MVGIVNSGQSKDGLEMHLMQLALAQIAQYFLGKIRKVEQSRKIGTLVEKFS